ncbi:MAG: hypothetical protein PHF86_01745 [Candidatus Nanoarchaeia archaeon]|nr:hypothetical protein [Candidatus Nanoarchaeia archaeon]
MKKDIKSIPINIWDDFYDDGYVPKGEIQKTYIYVEDNKLNIDFRKKCLEHLLSYIEHNIKFTSNPLPKFYMYFYDSWKKYPKLVGAENECMLFKRWEIKIENLSHKQLDKLLKDLSNASLSMEGIPFNIYSES